MGKRKPSSNSGSNPKAKMIKTSQQPALPIQTLRANTVVFPPSFSSNSSIMQKVKEDFTRNREEREKELAILNEIKLKLDAIKGTYFKNIKSGHPMKLAEAELNTCIEKIQQAISVDVTFIGSSGSGKSSLINMITGEDILPSGSGNEHVTRAILEIQYAQEYQVLIQYCNKDEFEKRKALAPKEVASVVFEEKKGSTQKFNSVQEIRQFLDKLFKEMKNEDLLQVDKVMVKLPVQLLKDFNLTIRDTPGRNSGTYGRVFNYFIEKSIQKTNMLLFFMEGRSSEISTTIFKDFIKPILIEHHKNPPSVKVLVGGVDIQNKDEGYENLKSVIPKNKIDFAKLLSMYTNIDLEDVISNLEPHLVNLEVKENNHDSLASEEFDIKNLREVCISLIKRFNTIAVPHFDASHFQSHRTDLIENYMHELVKEQARVLSLERKNIIEVSCSLVPLLMSICVNNFSDNQIKFYLNRIEDDLLLKMKEITNKFNDIILDEYDNDEYEYETYDSLMEQLRKIVSKRLKETISIQEFKNITMTCIKEIANRYPSIPLSKGRQELLLNNIEEVLKSCKKNITSVCKQLFSRLTKSTICRNEFKLQNGHPNIRNDLTTTMVELATFFNGLFDRSNLQRVNLIVETKLKLTELFEYYKQESQDEEYNYSIDTSLPIPSKENGDHIFNLDLPCQPLNQDQLQDPWENLKKLLATNDKLAKEKIIRNPSKMIRKEISDPNGTRVNFSAPNNIQLFNMPVIYNLQTFQTLFTYDNNENLAPIMIFAKDETKIKPNFLLNTLSKNMNTHNYLVFIFCQPSNWNSIIEKVGKCSAYHVIMVDKANFNKATFETAALEVAKFYKFPIYHTMTQKTGRVQEYVRNLKSFKTASFTFIRYLRFAQLTLQQELLQVDENNLKANIGKFLFKVRSFVIKELESNNFDCFSDGTFEASELMKDDSKAESFLMKLRELDDESGSSYAEDFLKIRLATNKARLVLWNGGSSIKDRRIFNTKKNNYYISYQHDLNSINTCYTPSMVNALEDQKLIQDVAVPDDYCEQSLKSGLLFSGAGQFVCYGFKFELFSETFERDE